MDVLICGAAARKCQIVFDDLTLPTYPPITPCYKKTETS